MNRRRSTPTRRPSNTRTSKSQKNKPVTPRRPQPAKKYPPWFIGLLLFLMAGGGALVIALFQYGPAWIEAFRRTPLPTPSASSTSTWIPSPAIPPTLIPTLTFMPSPSDTPIPQPTVATGRVEGLLTDREGNPISDVSVSIQFGPTTKTDMNGKYVLSEVSAGDQLIVVQPPFGDGQITLNVSILADQTNPVNIVYDAATSRLGLLSMTAPIDGGELDIRQDEVDNQGTTIIVHRAVIYGRSDGLAQIFPNGFDVYVLISSERDGKFWVQHPPAVVDPNNNEWRANIVLGDAEHPPQAGELWTILAVAVDPATGFDRILNTPRLSLLPPHITSNIVTVFATIH